MKLVERDWTAGSIAVAVLGVLVVMFLVGVVVWLLLLTPVTFTTSGGVVR